MDCPKCRLTNPPTAQRCDCGYDFESRTMQESYANPRAVPSEEVRRLGQRDILIGGIVFAIGVAVTAVTYGLAGGGGGQFVVAYGAIVWGVIQLVRGVDRSRTGVERAFWGGSRRR
jgi:hypothetical protein